MENPNLLQNINEQLPEKIKEVAESLKDNFGINQLSINELFIIKKITKEELERSKKIYEEIEKELGDRPNLIKEISVRFLLEAYGIDYAHIKGHRGKENHEQFLEYIRKTREKAHLI